MGYGESLMCSDCKKLAHHVNDDQMLTECQSCCTAETNAAQQIQYVSGTLEVCQWKIGRFPEVKDFIDNKAPTYPNLKIDWKRGADPSLVMKNPDGSEDQISINTWKTGTLSEFLDAKLRQ